jgi:hypothetical protein
MRVREEKMSAWGGLMDLMMITWRRLAMSVINSFDDLGARDNAKSMRQPGSRLGG